MLLIGIGNDYGRDDGVGLRIAREIRALCLDGVEVGTLTGDCARLVEMWKGKDRVILVDALYSGKSPGSVHRFDPGEEAFPGFSLLRTSTHSFGVTQAIELSRTLGRDPNQLIIYGIEGKTFEPGFGLSREVERAVPDVVRRILSELPTQEQ
jgi:hydrogenase maturation protease